MNVYNEIKQQNLYNKFLEKMRVSKPSYFQNYKLFETLKYNNNNNNNNNNILDSTRSGLPRLRESMTQ